MNDPITQKLRERAATLTDGSVFNANAKLRYMASGFSGVVFESETGGLRYSADRSATKHDNQGEIRAASVKAYQPPEPEFVASISRYAEPKEHYPEELSSVSKSEKFDTPEAAREWLQDQGLPLGELPSETLEEYGHPDDADKITVDLGNGDFLQAFYVIEDNGDALTLAHASMPHTPVFELDTNDREVQSLQDGSTRSVRKYFR